MGLGVRGQGSGVRSQGLVRRGHELVPEFTVASMVAALLFCFCHKERKGAQSVLGSGAEPQFLCELCVLCGKTQHLPSPLLFLLFFAANTDLARLH